MQEVNTRILVLTSSIMASSIQYTVEDDTTKEINITYAMLIFFVQEFNTWYQVLNQMIKASLPLYRGRDAMF